MLATDHSCLQIENREPVVEEQEKEKKTVRLVRVKLETRLISTRLNKLHKKSLSLSDGGKGPTLSVSSAVVCKKSETGATTFSPTATTPIFGIDAGVKQWSMVTMMTSRLRALHVGDI